MKLNAIALALGLISSSAFAGSVITIDPDGTGSIAAISVSTLDWAVGNTLSLPVTQGSLTPDPNGIIQSFGHSTLAGFFNGNTKQADGGLGTNYNWTYVFGTQETAMTFGNMTGFGTPTTAGGVNFFQVYYNANASEANMLNGTGFNNGKLIMSGNIVSTLGSFIAEFDQNGPVLGPLDQTGTDNYAGQTSTQGAGGTNLKGIVKIGYYDTDFFKGIGGDLTIDLQTTNSQAFAQTDPSSCFWNGTTLIGGAGQNSTNSAPASCSNTVGMVNGLQGPNIMFQTDASTSFVVPEPTSMALAGAGLLSLLGLRRKRA